MKKTHFFLLVLICLSLLIVGCGNDSPLGKSSSNDYTAISSAGFYKDVRMQPNGEFIARHKVTEEEAMSSGTVFKVDFNGNKQLEKITSMYSGTPIDTLWKDTADRGYTLSTVTVEYQDGYEKYNFKNSRMAPCHGFYNVYSIRYKLSDDKKQHKVAYLYNKDGEQEDNSLGFAQMLFTYDNNNALTKVGYAGVNGERVITANREYETRFKYDKSKKPVEVANYGKDESLMVDATGIAKTTYKLDNLGRTVEIRHYGSDEALKERKLDRPHIDDRDIISISAGAITKCSYDENSLVPNKISFFGKDEQPVGIKSWGNVASLHFKYTDKGQLAEFSTYGTDDTPYPLDKEEIGDNVVKIGYSYDGNGNLSKMTFYGKDDNMVVAAKLNAAEVHMKYDDKRRLTEEAYFGAGGDAIEVQKNGRTFHRIVREYNDDEITQYIYYSKDGKEVGKVKLSPSGEETSTAVSNSSRVNNNTGSSASQLSLGNIALGDEEADLPIKLGSPDKRSVRDGMTYYAYPDIEAKCQNGMIAYMASNSAAVSTNKGIHEQSSLQEVLSAYGYDYVKSGYNELDLYEYNMSDNDGKSCIMRFAVIPSTQRVKYISLRYV